jgi:S1-C subfamily serine protease
MMTVDPRRPPLRTILALSLLALLLVVPGCEVTLGEQTYDPIPITKGAAGRILRSTVDVRVTQQDGATIRGSLGTGVVVGRGGLVVTADHVLTFGDGGRVGEQIEVIAADGRRGSAVVVARVPDQDLALLKVSLQGLRPATFAPDLGDVDPGARVLAVGAPHRFVDRVRRGRVLRILTGSASVEGRDFDVLIQSSARIRRGFSGGPLADARGRLIGITIASTVPVQGGERTALAVPADVVLDALRQIQPVGAGLDMALQRQR